MADGCSSEQRGACLGAHVRQRRSGPPHVLRGVVHLYGGERGARAVEGAVAVVALAVPARRHQHAVRRARRAPRARLAQARHLLPLVLHTRLLMHFHVHTLIVILILAVARDFARHS